MAAIVYFAEKQRFNQWWLWLLLLGFNAVILYGLFQQLALGQEFGSKPLSDSGLIILFVIMGAFTFFFYKLSLDTQITDEGIGIRFSPFQSRMKMFRWSEISNVYTTEYSPLREYGGWGFRIGRKGVAYTISGNKGIQLILNNGKMVLIGTGKAKEVSDVLEKLKHSKGDI